MVPAGASDVPRSQASSLAVTVIAPPPAAASFAGGAVLVQAARAAAALTAAAASPARDVRDMQISSDGAGGAQELVVAGAGVATRLVCGRRKRVSTTAT